MARLLPLLSLMAKLVEFKAVCGTVGPHRGPVNYALFTQHCYIFPTVEYACCDVLLSITLELCINLFFFYCISENCQGVFRGWGLKILSQMVKCFY